VIRAVTIFMQYDRLCDQGVSIYQETPSCDVEHIHRMKVKVGCHLLHLFLFLPLSSIFIFKQAVFRSCQASVERESLTPYKALPLEEGMFISLTVLGVQEHQFQLKKAFLRVSFVLV